MGDLIERADAINAIRYVTDSPNYSKTLGELLRIPSVEQTEPSNSEKPNNCEHITEDGVTCAKYPACDDCLDNPLNKLKGSERLVKSKVSKVPTSSKMEQVDEPKDEPQTAECPFDDTIPCEWVNCPNSTDCPYKQKTEPQTNGYQTFNGTSVYVSRFEDEPQTERSE